MYIRKWKHCAIAPYVCMYVYMYMLKVRTYDNHAFVAVGVDQYGRQGETQLLGSAHVLVVCAPYPRSMGHDLLDQNRTGILTGDSTTIAK